MNDADYHALMADLLNQQRAPKEPRPDGVSEAQWKNRYLVSAKLPGPLYADFCVWCKSQNLSFNSALKQIIATHLDNA